MASGVDLQEHSVWVSVSDTGCGIPEEHLSSVFTPFFTTKSTGKGTGLGLAIAYGIVKMHRGSIRVQSNPGVGTTFTITLLLNGRQSSHLDVTTPMHGWIGGVPDEWVEPGRQDR